jgi:hypothetical protein
VLLKTGMKELEIRFYGNRLEDIISEKTLKMTKLLYVMCAPEIKINS